jgi:glutamate racemase
MAFHHFHSGNTGSNPVGDATRATTVAGHKPTRQGGPWRGFLFPDPGGAARGAISIMLIGVFDSGIGGLTVLRALWRAWPGHSTVYLGDTARVPYGSKSPQTVARYARQIVDYLLGQGAELIVVACNTASANAMDSLEGLPVPVVGVIEPGAVGAVEAARRRGIARPHYGVIGTRATVQSGAYQRALARLAPEARISAVACPLFVPLADEGWETTEVAHVVARQYLADWLPGRPDRPDVLVLGCTHYPVLRPTLEAVLGSEVTLVDSAETTARSLAPHLAGAPAEAAPRHRLILTDGATGFAQTASRLLGVETPAFEVVDLPQGAAASMD